MKKNPPAASIATATLDSPYCPFCGSRNVKIVFGVPRCLACRTFFVIAYRRKLRGK